MPWLIPAGLHESIVTNCLTTLRLRGLGVCLLALLEGPAGAPTVLSMGDGDTLRVRDGGRLTKGSLYCYLFELIEGIVRCI